jgi:hypothetical protein
MPRADLSDIREAAEQIYRRLTTLLGLNRAARSLDAAAKIEILLLHHQRTMMVSDDSLAQPPLPNGERFATGDQGAPSGPLM